MFCPTDLWIYRRRMAGDVKLCLKRFGELTVDELFDIVRLRQEVFFLGQHIDCEDLDDMDRLSVFLWAECDGQTVGFLRIIPPGAVYEEATFGRVAVREGWRRRGIAMRMTAAALEYMAREWGGDVRISSQEYVVPMYEKLGFEVVSERYFEAGIPHRKMLKKR